jgi:hypothetical protein
MLSKEIQLEVKQVCFQWRSFTQLREGFHTGTAAHFVRMAVAMYCHWWMLKKVECLHPPTSVDLVVANASKYAETVVVTGGGNRHVDMTLLTQMLNSATEKLDLTRYRSATVTPLTN